MQWFFQASVKKYLNIYTTESFNIFSLLHVFTVSWKYSLSCDQDVTWQHRKHISTTKATGMKHMGVSLFFLPFFPDFVSLINKCLWPSHWKTTPQQPSKLALYLGFFHHYIHIPTKPWKHTQTRSEHASIFHFSCMDAFGPSTVPIGHCVCMWA